MLDDLDPDIRRAAKSVAFQWPGVVTEDEVKQDIYLRLLESPGSVDKIRRMDEMAQYRAIVGMGHQIASRERKEYAGFTLNYRYSMKEARALLTNGGLRWDETDPPVQQPLDDEADEGTTVAGPRCPVPAEIMDLRAGMELLKQRHLRYAEAITRRYLFEEVPVGSEMKVLQRAVGALTEEMNRVHRTAYATRDDGPGTRRSMPSTTAQDITRTELKGRSPDYRGNRELWERPKHYGI